MGTNSRRFVGFTKGVSEMQKIVAIALSTLVLTVQAESAFSSIIIQPASASTTAGGVSGFVNISHTVDQSGLSAGYTSGVDDFDVYLASNPTHANAPSANRFTSASNEVPGQIDFDLGGTFTIESFASWNMGSSSGNPEPSGILDFTLIADDNAGFSSPTVLGSFTASTVGDFFNMPAQIFTFASTQSSFVRMSITSTVNDSNFSLGEAAFEKSSAVIPEPSTLVLWSLGAIALVGLGWRRRKRAA